MKKVLLSAEALTIALIVIALIIGASTSRYFLDFHFLLDKTSYYVPIAITAITLTFVIVSGNIDLSVASGTVLVSVLSAQLYAHGLPMAAVIPGALVIGGILGWFNGFIITKLRLPSLVVTLGTLALYRGLAQVVVGEGTVKGFPDWFNGVDNIWIAKLPLPFLLLLTLTVVGSLVLKRTTFGRIAIALGTNENATRYSGIAVDKLKVRLFTISGISMGLAALVLMSEIQSADYKQLGGGELLGITAVVLGGTSIFGGKGTVWGTFLAMILLVVVRSAMGVANVHAENQLAVVGALLIFSVLFSNWVYTFSQRRRRKNA